MWCFCQNLEVVPLFGDMQIAPFNYVKRSKHFEPSKWPLSSSVNISPQSDIMIHLPQIRDDHVKYISELARYSNEVRLKHNLILTLARYQCLATDGKNVQYSNIHTTTGYIFWS